MQRFHQALPVWVRAVLLVGLVCLIAGAGLVAYRYYERPITLTVAVGSFDGEARQDLYRSARLEEDACAPP